MISATKEYREMDEAAILVRINQLKQELRSADEAVRQGKEKNHASLKWLKKDIARANTVLTEKRSK